MYKELTVIFIKTLNVHFPNKTGISKDDYVKKFKTISTKEITDAPTLDVEQGNLATYLKLSILVMAMVKLYQTRSEQCKNGVNGFKIKYIAGVNQNEFGVDYLKCGICDYFSRKNMFEYVKYCCLVDYAIMKNMGISFSRTTTLGNGGKKCDFRFANEGKIEEGWPPTNLKEFNRN